MAVVTEAWYVDLTKLAPEQQRQAMGMAPSELIDVVKTYLK